ncbi:MAG: glycoside hydrolase family 16 protein [Deltaproteobacteria bacterium]|nr:glycoside hydrolase family 16 protein [Deltaproteobacteria bacterium]
MLALLILLGCTDPNPTDGEWSVVWEDDFEGSAGEAPNPDYWAYDVGGDGWGNSQLEYDTDRTDNASLDGSGNLRIVALEEEYEGNAYTSARLNTLGLFEHGYGRYEARIKLPAGGKGIWPAFWLLGNNFPEVGWPWCGEVDIMEFRGSEPETVTGTLHGPGYSGALGIGSETTLDEGDFTEDFHDFAVEIDPGHIAWTVDGEQVQRISRADLPENATWVFDMIELENDEDGFFIILNLAVGGHYDGDPDETTEFPAEMLVDWVRVSERGYTRAVDEDDDW